MALSGGGARPSRAYVSHEASAGDLRGQLAAVCSPDRVYFADWIEILELDHPVRRFVSAMCLHAGEVLNGSAAAPYSDADARRRARTRLAPVADLLDSIGATDAKLAEHLNLPLEELRLARHQRDEHGERSDLTQAPGERPSRADR